MKQDVARVFITYVCINVHIYIYTHTHPYIHVCVLIEPLSCTYKMNLTVRFL